MGIERAVPSLLLTVMLWPSTVVAGPLMAGVARVEITDRSAGPVNDPSYAKALVLKDGATSAVIITVDAVAIGELGRIGNSYLANVRAQLHKDLGIPPANVLVNASHCHSVVRADADRLTVQTAKEAASKLQPVKAGAGRGREDRIMENRRLRMRDGSEMDVRHAYSMPTDEDVAGIGPVDPEIGLLRLDGLDGRPLAVVYNFAVHPIMGVPGGANTADISGFASKVIEENLGGGATAFFLQGCAGDINPAKYKEVHHPRDAEPLGNLLGLSALRALRDIRTRDDATFRWIQEVLALPRTTDYEQRISAIQAEQARLLASLKGTSLNLKTFLPLFMKFKVSDEFPSYYSYRYLHEKAAGREELRRLDAENRANLEQYIRNIHTMEQLTRLQTNLDLLRMHQAQTAAAGSKTIDAEVVGVRIGDFVLVTFPGELSVEIGLGLKKRAQAPFTFVAGYTNGYIYYTPTAEQRRNPGYAQEDCDTLVAPEWQQVFERRVAAILDKLSAP
ncbi:MAG: hypothetical protein LLG20_19135 [Acidobacteriales bacterium]|nr:hypothetical protein [Terriglobales bacterium]